MQVLANRTWTTLRSSPWWRFGGAFLLLQTGWHWCATRGIGNTLVEALAVRPAAFLIDWLTPGLAISAQGRTLVTLGSQLQIRPGCDGADLAILACAAAVAAPLPARARLTGLLAGAATALALNQLRIVTLFYLQRAAPGQFPIWHELVLPVTLTLVMLAGFQGWLTLHGSAAKMKPGSGGNARA